MPIILSKSILYSQWKNVHSYSTGKQSSNSSWIFPFLLKLDWVDAGNRSQNVPSSEGIICRWRSYTLTIPVASARSLTFLPFLGSSQKQGKAWLRDVCVFNWGTKIHFNTEGPIIPKESSPIMSASLPNCLILATCSLNNRDCPIAPLWSNWFNVCVCLCVCVYSWQQTRWCNSSRRAARSSLCGWPVMRPSPPG